MAVSCRSCAMIHARVSGALLARHMLNSHARDDAASRQILRSELVPHTSRAPRPLRFSSALAAPPDACKLDGSARHGGGQPAQLAAMSQQQGQRRKPLLTVVVPGADVAPDRSHLEPRRSVHGGRRSSVASAAFELCVRRFHLRALAWLCGALALALLLLLQAVRLRARSKLPLLMLGLGPTDEQARAPDPLSPARAEPPPHAALLRPRALRPRVHRARGQGVEAGLDDARVARLRVAARQRHQAGHDGVVGRSHAALAPQLGPEGRFIPRHAFATVRAPVLCTQRRC